MEKKHLYIAIVVQTVAIIWWAATLDSRVTQNTEWIKENKEHIEFIGQLVERVQALHEEINELELRR
jgi:hypothetical protein